MPEPATVLTCLDKRELYRLARELEVPTPSTFLFTSQSDWMSKAEQLGFPVVIKRGNSFSLVKDRKALIVESAAELGSYLGSEEAAQDPTSLILQKRVDGNRHNCHFVAVEGKVAAFFQQEVLRTDTFDSTGYGVEGVTVPPDEKMRVYTERLVARLKYTGVGCAQFLRATDGRPYFLEINPRLDATCVLPYFCGYDFPRYAMDCARRTLSVAVGSYPTGIRFHWLLGDFQGWRRAVRRRQVTSGRAVKWLGQMCRAFGSNRCHATWSWSDPLPTFYLYGQVVSDLFKGVYHRFAGRS